MNIKHLTIIALVIMLALVMPASAVWSNGNWVTDDKKDEYFGNAEVKYDPTTGVTSKYTAPMSIDLMTYQGMVVGNLKSGQVVSGGERFYFHRIDAPENVTMVQYFEPDGKYTGYLAPGEYEVVLPQGTGSAAGIYSDDWGYVGNLHEERTNITVAAGQVSYFSFIGNSVSSYDRGLPEGASINVGLGCDDVRIRWIKLVKTGEHQYTPPCYIKHHRAITHKEYKYIVSAAVPAIPEVDSNWVLTVPDGKTIIDTRIVTDAPEHTEYRYPIMDDNEIADEREVGYGPGHHHEVKCTNPSHSSGWHDKVYECNHGQHQDGMSDWSDTRASPSHRAGEETRTVPAVTHTEYKYIISPAVPAQDAVISDWVLHVPFGKFPVDMRTVTDREAYDETICPPTVTIPEYGFEYMLEIDGYNADITNPNRDPVNVQFSFDLNYFVDTEPWFWDHDATDGSIVSRTKTIAGSVNNVNTGTITYHGVITPDVETEVAVFDWQHGFQYVPSISNAKVTSTAWAN